MSEQVVIRGRRARRGISEFQFAEKDLPALKQGGLLADFAQKAWRVYQETPFPTTKDEPWRRTDISGLDTQSIRLTSEDKFVSGVPEYLLKPLVGDEHGGLIAFSGNGDATIQIDPEIENLGVIFTDILTANRKYPDKLEKVLGKVVRPEEGKFSALASAMFQNGVFLYVPRNVNVPYPLHSVLWAAGKSLGYFTRLLVYLEDGASVTYVHEYASDSETDAQTLHNVVVEMYVGPRANLRFVELQSLGNHVWNFTHERIKVDNDASVDWIFGAVGSHLTKNFSDLDLIGEGASGRMSGFYFTDGVQHLDHDTQQNHLAAHTTSDLLFKGALKGHSRSVWQGMIYVAEGAQQTDGYQANRNLVLSNNAHADSIPGLEILANDVRCTHGATVGKIDPDLIFYLRSRGIPLFEAEKLIVEGFFDPIMQRIPYDGVRERFISAIEHKMAKSD